MDQLTDIANLVRMNKGLPALPALTPDMRLREDLGFDSLDLAELTARIDERFHVDVFAAGIVFTVGEIAERLRRG
ncbi:MAG: acyl carrier protein [Opitutaceae bacterium]|nr:acyl carrier protein [Opitutaceae bacterium]